jgi:hypothetical protein
MRLSSMVHRLSFVHVGIFSFKTMIFRPADILIVVHLGSKKKLCSLSTFST